MQRPPRRTLPFYDEQRAASPKAATLRTVPPPPGPVPAPASAPGRTGPAGTSPSRAKTAHAAPPRRAGTVLDAQPVAAAKIGAMHADAGPARRLLTSRAGWAAAGFLAGVVFWHFVGFWHFVTDVILTREPATASRVAPDKLASDGKPRTTLLGTMPPSRVAVADTCSSLRLDRTTGRTSLDACAAGLLTEATPLAALAAAASPCPTLRLAYLAPCWALS